MRYNHIPIRIAKTKQKLTTPNANKLWRNWNSRTLLVGDVMAQLLWKTVCHLNIFLPYPAIPLLGIYLNEMKTYV